MSDNGEDMNKSMMLDGNAAAGVLYDIFSREMTVAPTECATCGRRGEIGSLLAFTQSPGLVLRCPACESVVVRVSHMGSSTYLDARGAVYIRLST